MTTKKPSTVTNATGAYSYKSGISSSSTNYIDNTFLNLLDKTGDNSGNGGGVTGNIEFLSGSALTFDTGAVLDFTGSSTLVFANTSELIFDNSSILELNDTSTMITGGSTQMLIGGTMNITSGGTFNLNSTGNMHIKNGATMTVDSGGTVAFASGAIGTVTGAATMTYSSGANLNMNAGSFLNITGADLIIGSSSIVTVGGATTVILSNGGASFLTIGTGNTFNVHGTHKTDVWPSWNVALSRQSNMPIDHGAAAQGATNWLNIGTGLQNTNSASPQVIGQQTLEIPLTRLHNGSTLASVFIAFYVGTTHTGVPQNLPTFTVYRFNPLSNPTSIQYLSTTAVQSPTNPGSGAAWYNSGNVQYYQYITNQNNVIDNTNYLYYMSVADESGTNSLGGNAYIAVTAENQVITDTSWNI